MICRCLYKALIVSVRLNLLSARSCFFITYFQVVSAIRLTSLCTIIAFNFLEHPVSILWPEVVYPVLAIRYFADRELANGNVGLFCIEFLDRDSEFFYQIAISTG